MKIDHKRPHRVSKRWRREFVVMIPVIWKDQYSVRRLTRFCAIRKMNNAVIEAQALLNND